MGEVGGGESGVAGRGAGEGESGGGEKGDGANEGKCGEEREEEPGVVEAGADRGLAAKSSEGVKKREEVSGGRVERKRETRARHVKRTHPVPFPERLNSLNALVTFLSCSKVSR